MVTGCHSFDKLHSMARCLMPTLRKEAAMCEGVIGKEVGATLRSLEECFQPASMKTRTLVLQLRS